MSHIKRSRTTPVRMPVIFACDLRVCIVAEFAEFAEFRVRTFCTVFKAARRAARAANAASLNLAASCQPVLVTFSSRASSCPLKVAELL